MYVQYGDGRLEFELPDCEVDVAEPDRGTTVDVREAAKRALSAPHGPNLGDLVDQGDEVAIVVTDVTRSAPDDVLLDAMLEELPAPRDVVTIVVGLGLHRPMTEAELREGLGEHAPLSINHDPDQVVRVGTVAVGNGGDEADDGDEADGEPNEIPIEVHEAVADADVVLSTGVVEPHQYAGFSGGAKTVAIGAGGEPLIRETHGPAMLSRPGVRLGRIEDNPFRETIDRAGDLVGPDFCCNVATGEAGVLDVAAGRPRPVVRELAETARSASSARVSGEEYDVVVAGVPAPKDANLYQASRAATYVLLGPYDPVAPGGRIVVPARLPEGAGTGTGERRFRRRLENATDAESLYERLQRGYEPGAQRAFVLARALRDADLWVTNAGGAAPVDSPLVRTTPDVVDAIPAGSRVLVVPDAIHTLVRSPSNSSLGSISDRTRS
ncbi:MAG: lactate racemase domain-containing protein [Haloferacaceae archaeon]